MSRKAIIVTSAVVAAAMERLNHDHDVIIADEFPIHEREEIPPHPTSPWVPPQRPIQEWQGRGKRKMRKPR